eukprot:1160247-Pelagomonas_calceolata.AAC.3
MRAASWQALSLLFLHTKSWRPFSHSHNSMELQKGPQNRAAQQCDNDSPLFQAQAAVASAKLSV